jgi:hypothetical protein
LNLIRAITLSVASAPAAARRYRDWFDYIPIDEGVVDDELALSWGSNAAAGQPFFVLRSRSGIKADLRLVQNAPHAGYRPMRTFGWAALEVCVTDVQAVHARLRNSPFRIIGPPGAIANLPTIHPMQVQGPDDEVVFLTQILASGPATGLPQAQVPIDRPFICVLGSADAPAAARWFAQRLPMIAAPPLSIAYGTLNRAFGLPADRHHDFITGAHAAEIFLEIDQYPAAATSRARHDHSLPPAVALCSFLHSDLDAVPGPWISRPARRYGQIYEGRRAGTQQMPDGTLVEFIEAPLHESPCVMDAS